MMTKNNWWTLYAGHQQYLEQVWGRNSEHVAGRDWDEADFSNMSGAGHQVDAFAPAPNVSVKALLNDGKVYFVEYEDFTPADRGLDYA